MIGDIAVYSVVLLVWVHFIADFVLQSRYMAEQKSSENKALLLHVGIYTACLLVFLNPLFALVNGVLHFATDYVTSRLSSRYWKDGSTGAFFRVIGADQAIHITTLVVTYVLIIG